jgi:hypothetical protein
VTDWFGKDIKDGIGDDLSVDADNVGTLRDTPDAKNGQQSHLVVYTGA